MFCADVALNEKTEGNGRQRCRKSEHNASSTQLSDARYWEVINQKMHNANQTWSLDVVNVTLFGANTADMNGAKVKAILYQPC